MIQSRVMADMIHVREKREFAQFEQHIFYSMGVVGSDFGRWEGRKFLTIRMNCFCFIQNLSYCFRKGQWNDTFEVQQRRVILDIRWAR